MTLGRLPAVWLFLLLVAGNTHHSLVVLAQQQPACSADGTTTALADCFTLRRVTQALRIECLTCLSAARSGCDTGPICQAYESSCPACANSPCLEEYKGFFNCRLQREGCPGFQCNSGSASNEAASGTTTTLTVAATTPPPTSTSTTTTAPLLPVVTPASTSTTSTTTASTTTSTTTTQAATVPATTSSSTISNTPPAVACSPADTTRELGECLDDKRVMQNERVACFSCLAGFRQQHAISPNKNCITAMDDICPAFLACTTCHSCAPQVQAFYECEIRRGDDCPNFACPPISLAGGDGGDTTSVVVTTTTTTPSPTPPPTPWPTTAPTPPPTPWPTPPTTGSTTTTTTTSVLQQQEVVEQQEPVTVNAAGSMVCRLLESTCDASSNTICCYPAFCIAGVCQQLQATTGNKDSLKSQLSDREVRLNRGNRRRRLGGGGNAAAATLRGRRRFD